MERDMLVEGFENEARVEEAEAEGMYPNGIHGVAGGEGAAGGYGQDLNGDAEGQEEEELASQEPPTSILVTSLTLDTFEQPTERDRFESLFHDIDESVSFQYFKSFRRVRVNFASHDQASKGRDKVHLMEFNGEVIKSYFTQPITLGSIRGGGPHLQPPKREKQYLISPPASPPVGWEPIEEAEPIINFDLISAVANLAPGESHELHPPMEDKPGIIVHICEDCQICDSSQGGARPRIIQTRRPT